MFSLPIFFQILTLGGLGVCLFKVLSLVRAETISDKYGVAWFVALAALLAVSAATRWFSLLSPAAEIFVFFLFFAFIALGISLSMQLTDYSRARRQSVQEMALLRFRFQELEANLQSQPSADSSF